MEIYIEVGISATLCLKKLQPADGLMSVAISNAITYGLAAILVAFPIWIVVFYSLQISRWPDEDF